MTYLNFFLFSVVFQFSTMSMSLIIWQFFLKNLLSTKHRDEYWVIITFVLKKITDKYTLKKKEIISEISIYLK